MTRKRTRQIFERGLEYRRAEVLADLAADMPPGQIAKKYEVHLQTVYRFRNKHRAEFEQVDRLAVERALEPFITKKANRLTVYQESVNKLRDKLDRVDHPKDVALIAAELRLTLGAAASELGQIPRAPTVQVIGDVNVSADNRRVSAALFTDDEAAEAVLRLIELSGATPAALPEPDLEEAYGDD